MDPSQATISPKMRYSIYAILIVASFSTHLGRIANVSSRDGKSPFLSANDRSRWATVAAWVDTGTFEIDEIMQRPGWNTIDKVRHPGRDGVPHYYSSKPPFMSILVAAPYWVLHRVAGISLLTQPFLAVRMLLVVCNLVPLTIVFVLIAKKLEEATLGDWSRIFVMAGATWGTFLTTFVVTLNNHLPAACCTLIAMDATDRILRRGGGPLWRFGIAGLSAALAAALELPALGLLVLTACFLAGQQPLRTVFGFGLPALLVIGAYFGANYVVHDTWQPAYAQRHTVGGWYDYPGSYWFDPSKLAGVDRGEPSMARYGFHVLLGHHGILSLTPMWALSLAGTVLLITQDRTERRWRWATTLLTLACLTFYVMLRPTADRNYGGVCSGFRWAFWLIGPWLLSMLPALQRLEQRVWGRCLALILLAASVFSASVPMSNPWTHPWIYRVAWECGWIR